MADEFCEICGRKLTFFNHTLSRSKRCNHCASGRSPEGRQFQWSGYFERTAGLTESGITSRSILATAPRLIGAWIIVCGMVYVGRLAPIVGGLLGSLIGCFVGLGIAKVLLFRSVCPVDLLRWQRHWSGLLLGYWVTYLLLVFFLGEIVIKAALLLGLTTLSAAATLAFAAACLVGLIVGFLNVARADPEDKAQVLAHFRLWQQAGATQADQPQQTQTPPPPTIDQLP